MKIVNCIGSFSSSSIIIFIIVLFLGKLTTATTINTKAKPIEIVFLIRSQAAPPHNQLGQQLKENLTRQAKELQPKYNIKIQILHELFNQPGEWTILHIIPHLMSSLLVPPVPMGTTTHTHTTTETAKSPTKQIDNGVELITNLTRWIIFCEERTNVNVRQLLQRLTNENHKQPLFLGHPLYDREPTIIHHFAFFENPKWFPYPMLGAGIVFSMPLLKSIADIFSHHSKQQQQYHQPPLLHSEFSIDAAHELARFIYDNVQMPATETEDDNEKDPQNEDVRPVNTATTSSLNDSKSPDVTVYYRTTTTMTSNSDTATTRTTATHPKAAMRDDNTQHHHNDIDNADDDVNGADNASDFRHSNEIIDDARSKVVVAAASAQAKQKKKKIILKKAPYICPEANWETGNNKAACAMYAKPETSSALPESCIPAERDEIYFAVKTCSKFHKERLPVIQTTWAPYAKHIHYFSDVEDINIPTINTGFANVEMGHCAKTLQILKLALRDIESHNSNNEDDNNFVNNNNKHYQQHLNQYGGKKKNKGKSSQIQWLMLTDDDTLLSVSGVCQVLGCYNSMDEIYLGERYGYRLHAPDGFNYITGGGGIAFSVPALRRIVQHCSCPTPSAPDDMILGSCLHTLQMKALHSAHFHQARPNDYPTERLRQEVPVSFHKFWQMDPREIYRQWFFDNDDRMLLHEAKAVDDEEDVVAEQRYEVKLHSYPTLSSKHIDYYHKNRNLLAKPQEFDDLNVPVSLLATLHQHPHTKERHVDL
ncbi:beta-1,3-glucosyltransferase [Musca autumnalis]|uniref:beta-1,3-glucosyltransferase n=1 Tax=Musca autumnalis TaxID=221902 RepID=UPI003CF455C2